MANKQLSQEISNGVAKFQEENKGIMNQVGGGMTIEKGARFGIDINKVPTAEPWSVGEGDNKRSGQWIAIPTNKGRISWRSLSSLGCADILDLYTKSLDKDIEVVDVNTSVRRRNDGTPFEVRSYTMQFVNKVQG